jgi:lipopolysaccharide biosynthesis glycosyltransferase
MGLQFYYHNKNNKHFKSFHSVLLDLARPEEYFNAGMLVFNIKQFRAQISFDETISLCSSRNWPIHDQDILNFVCNGKVYLLPYQWNFMSQNTGSLPLQLKQEYIAAQNNPKIIHYKPYKNWYFIPYSEFFWKYAAHSSFFDAILQQMRNEKLIGIQPIEKLIYQDIENNNIFGIIFLIKCCLLWVRKKIFKLLFWK